MTFEEYLKIDATNWTLLKELRRSPLAYKHRLTHDRPDADALRLGRAGHTAVFEPDRVPLEYAVFTGARRAGKDWDAFELAHDGRTILTRAQYANACGIRDAVRSHPLVKPYLAAGEPEKVLTWTDEKTGIRCKARLDWLCELAVGDLKTSRHATNPRLFASSAWDLGYFHQIAFYTRGARAVSGVDRPAVIFAVEPTAPHDAAVYKLDEDALATAAGQVDDLLRLLAECREADVWPGAHADEIALGLPRWATPDIEDMDLSDPDWAAGA